MARKRKGLISLRLDMPPKASTEPKRFIREVAVGVGAEVARQTITLDVLKDVKWIDAIGLS